MSSVSCRPVPPPRSRQKPCGPRRACRTRERSNAQDYASWFHAWTSSVLVWINCVSHSHKYASVCTCSHGSFLTNPRSLLHLIVQEPDKNESLEISDAVKQMMKLAATCYTLHCCTALATVEAHKNVIITFEFLRTSSLSLNVSKVTKAGLQPCTLGPAGM